jgi:hypothetical protein
MIGIREGAARMYRGVSMEIEVRNTAILVRPALHIDDQNNGIR